MSRFRWSSLYSPTNKSKLAFKFWHPRVHDYCTILCSRPSCVSRNTNKLLLCTSAKNFMLIIGSAPVNFFYFIFLLKTKESASLAWLFLHTGRWPACIESVFYWICGSRIFLLETLVSNICSLTLGRRVTVLALSFVRSFIRSVHRAAEMSGRFYALVRLWAWQARQWLAIWLVDFAKMLLLSSYDWLALSEFSEDKTSHSWIHRPVIH